MLFNYLDDGGDSHPIGSDEVNEYLRDITGEDITAKDFRTWAATNLAALALRELEIYDTRAKAKKNMVLAVELVAIILGNTPAICRKCYIHPEVFEGYLGGSLLDALRNRANLKLSAPGEGLTAEEAALIAFLSLRLSQKTAQNGQH